MKTKFDEGGYGIDLTGWELAEDVTLITETMKKNMIELIEAMKNKFDERIQKVTEEVLKETITNGLGLMLFCRSDGKPSELNVFMPSNIGAKDGEPIWTAPFTKV